MFLICVCVCVCFFLFSEVASAAGFCVIPDFCGHGIGTYFHGLPDIFHIGKYQIL